MTEVKRKVGQFALNYCPLQKMYNISNEIMLEYTPTEGTSFWFDAESAEIFKLCSDNEFILRCTQAVGNTIPEFFEGDNVKILSTRKVGKITGVKFLGMDNYPYYSYVTDVAGERKLCELKKGTEFSSLEFQELLNLESNILGYKELGYSKEIADAYILTSSARKFPAEFVGLMIEYLYK